MDDKKYSPDDQCRIEHSMLEYNIKSLIEKIDSISTTVNRINTDVNVLNTKVDDFSNRLKKLEERDEQIQGLQQRLVTIIERLEPDVHQLQKHHDELAKKETEDMGSLDKRITKIENNWGWVCTLVGFVAGLVVWGFQMVVHHLFFK